jgi:hypothetical protein
LALARCLSNLTVEYVGEDVERAVAIGREAVEVAGRAGVVLWRDYTEANLALSLMAAGRWDELEELLEKMRRQQATSFVSRLVGRAVRAMLAAARGEPVDVSEEGADGAVSDDASDRAWSGLAAALAEQTQGLTDRATARAAQSVDEIYALSGTSDDFVHIWPVAMDLAVANGDLATARRLQAIVDDEVLRLKVPPAVRNHRDRFAALLARDGDPDQVEPLLRSAVDGFAAWGSPHYRARATGELGLWLREQGRADEAAPLLDAARATLTQMGAWDWLSRIEGREVPAS